MKLFKVLFLLSLFLTVNILGQSFKFVIMSDSRGEYNGVNQPVLSVFANDIAENHKDVKFVIFAGDMTNGNRNNPDKTYNELMNWRNVMSPIYNSPNMIWPKVWPAVGNHEIQSRFDEDIFRKVFPDVFANGPADEKGLAYSFDYENTHFQIFDTDRWDFGDIADTTDDKPGWHTIKNIDWIEKDLAAAKARGIKHIFTVSHEMAFPTGGHMRDGIPNLGKHLKLPLDSAQTAHLALRDKYWDLQKKYNVDAHLCGHEHTYTRQSVDGIFEIIAGSAGAPLYYPNPKFGEKKRNSLFWHEFTYEEAIPYYKALKYNYGPGKNSQKSEDFVTRRAFNYVIISVDGNSVSATTYGIYPKKNTNDKISKNYKIKIIDSFKIK